jgi:hypothetical protein
MFLLPQSSGDESKSPCPTAIPLGVTDNPAVHPECKAFSFPRLIGRMIQLRGRGDLGRADELQSAMERALNIKFGPMTFLKP